MVEVTQADRDAAAHLAEQIDEPEIAEAIRAGKRDPYAWVQAFARHRLTAEQAKDAEIAERDALLRDCRKILDRAATWIDQDPGPRGPAEDAAHTSIIKALDGEIARIDALSKQDTKQEERK